MADGGLKLLLDGNRGAASDGGRLRIISSGSNQTGELASAMAYDPILASPLSS